AGPASEGPASDAGGETSAPAAGQATPPLLLAARSGSPGTGAVSAPATRTLRVARPVEPRTPFRDALAAAEKLLAVGDGEAARRAMDRAREGYRAWFDKKVATADERELIDFGAGGLLLGADDVTDAAEEALWERVKQEVQQALDQFDPCSQVRSERVDQLARALARADLAGVPDMSKEEAAKKGLVPYDRKTVEAALIHWQERQEAAARGEADPECPGFLFEAPLEIPAVGGSGVSVYLVTCDGTDWEGELSGEMSMSGGGGSLTIQPFFALSFPGVGTEPGAVGEQDLDGRIQWRLDGGGAVAEWHTESARGHATLRITEDGVTVEVDLDPVVATGQVEVAGRTVPLTIPVTLGHGQASGVLEQAGLVCGTNGAHDGGGG
ncbi:MAG: hypothetical protein D6683_01990, partial [Actinomyces sp.]